METLSGPASDEEVCKYYFGERIAEHGSGGVGAFYDIYEIYSSFDPTLSAIDYVVLKETNDGIISMQERVTSSELSGLLARVNHPVTKIYQALQQGSGRVTFDSEDWAVAASGLMAYCDLHLQ